LLEPPCFAHGMTTILVDLVKVMVHLTITAKRRYILRKTWDTRRGLLPIQQGVSSLGQQPHRTDLAENHLWWSA
jgi:hypothetical protein